MCLSRYARPKQRRIEHLGFYSRPRRLRSLRRAGKGPDSSICRKQNQLERIVDNFAAAFGSQRPPRH